MTEPPSPRRIYEATLALAAARDRLLAEDPDLESDQRLFHDMVEGEAEGDPFAVLDQVIRAAIEADAMAEAAKVRADAMLARAARFAKRRDALRGIAFAALDSLGIKRHERPDFTASVRAGVPSVTITDESAIPETYWRMTRTPDKGLIRADLKSGVPVPGAELSNAAPSLAIKTT